MYQRKRDTSTALRRRKKCETPQCKTTDPDNLVFTTLDISTGDIVNLTLDQIRELLSRLELAPEPTPTPPATPPIITISAGDNQPLSISPIVFPDRIVLDIPYTFSNFTRDVRVRITQSNLPVYVQLSGTFNTYFLFMETTRNGQTTDEIIEEANPEQVYSIPNTNPPYMEINLHIELFFLSGMDIMTVVGTVQ